MSTNKEWYRFSVLCNGEEETFQLSLLSSSEVEPMRKQVENHFQNNAGEDEV